MAFNFDSGQFNREKTPRHQGNFEVPRWAPSRARPLEYRPDPKPICDQNGHFLPGAPRGSSKCFGHFTGTWDLPRKITREVAAQLAKEPPDGRFPDWINLRVQRPQELLRMREKKRTKQTKAEIAEEQLRVEKSFRDSLDDKAELAKEDDKEANEDCEGERRDSCDDDPLGLREEKVPLDESGNGPYVPGSLTEHNHRHPTHQLLVDRAVEQLHGPQPDKIDTFWTKVAENAREDELARDSNMQCHVKSNTLKLPQVNIAQHFNFAKKMHVGNLEHQPLPDTLGYRNLQKIGEHRDSDIVVKPYAIGWKGYGASGPTCCTKMRVHRPKTCDVAKPEGEKDEKLRPSTSMPDLGGQYKKSLSLMDLAICWDFRPDNPKIEPKPPKHIDGSNGSKAPAVFTMVHTPKGDSLEQARFAHSNPIFTQNEINNESGRHLVPYFEKDLSKEKRRDSCDVQYCAQHSKENDKMKQRNSNGAKHSKPACDGIHGCGTPSASSRSSSRKPSQKSLRPDNLQAIKHAWNDINEMSGQTGTDKNKIRNSIDSYENTPLARGKLVQSSPNDSSKDSTTSNNNNGKHKSCYSCNGSHGKSPTEELPRKEDYKFAFKAGNPNSVQGSSTTQDSKGMKIPKMRHPYSKKSYSIPTLAPPFSIWKDADASGYPEHWRLASVYQHAYKPPEQRRKPLISSVFQ